MNSVACSAPLEQGEVLGVVSADSPAPQLDVRSFAAEAAAFVGDHMVVEGVAALADDQAIQRLQDIGLLAS